MQKQWWASWANSITANVTKYHSITANVTKYQDMRNTEVWRKLPNSYIGKKIKRTWAVWAVTFVLVGPILDDRLKEKLLKPWKGALSSHFRVFLFHYDDCTLHMSILINCEGKSRAQNELYIAYMNIVHSHIWGIITRSQWYLQSCNSLMEV